MSRLTEWYYDVGHAARTALVWIPLWAAFIPTALAISDPRWVTIPVAGAFTLMAAFLAQLAVEPLLYANVVTLGGLADLIRRSHPGEQLAIPKFRGVTLDIFQAPA